MASYRIKIADTAAEREQIHALNYATFVEEIPQHAANSQRRLVDRFDAENAYVVAVDAAGEVLGMLALRACRPFSLDQKLARLDDYLPPHRSVCELRLLAIKAPWRKGLLLRDLLAFAAQRALQEGHDLAIISGTTRQLDLYRRLGFEPFGPLVGRADAQFQPMRLTLEAFLAGGGRSLGMAPETARRTASFLPGPVAHGAAVNAAIAAPPISHRSIEFRKLMEWARAAICELTGAADAVLLLGSGTLANDVVAQSLRGLAQPGLVLANGEFGERLLDHAQRAGLQFAPLRKSWGEPFAEAEIASALRSARAAWLWAVHCETSSGVLNDLQMLKGAATAAGCELCLDCISSIGCLPLDLAGVRLASGASGKGLGAYAGVAMVLLGGAAPHCAPQVPRYLDLEYWLRHRSAPFTHSSNLLAALAAALQSGDFAARYRQIERDGRWLRQMLQARDLTLVAPQECASAAVTTIALPPAVASLAVAAALETQGILLSAHSDYLVERNWIQVALMGEYDRGALRELPDAIAQAVASGCGRQDRAA
ncbi:MAG: aminotransferase class V-fold PLP-dependent enzyme [Betaproteobacteria bacterium]|nr:MAG: aminotransferase class V-fold PLP-dependent enzyme [Betaproteobacteria bacterium]